MFTKNQECPRSREIGMWEKSQCWFQNVKGSSSTARSEGRAVCRRMSPGTPRKYMASDRPRGTEWCGQSVYPHTH